MKVMDLLSGLLSGPQRIVAPKPEHAREAFTGAWSSYVLSPPSKHKAAMLEALRMVSGDCAESKPAFDAWSHASIPGYGAFMEAAEAERAADAEREEGERLLAEAEGDEGCDCVNCAPFRKRKKRVCA